MPGYEYNISDVKIGDKIAYKDPYVRECTMPWIVVGILDTTVLIELTYKGRHQKRAIDISEVLEVFTD